ncbi:hypothetical protein L6164_010132 [Bauhinia variegata]|uniref:Uncharacterized protein n=1 Tax=Bauhinia variegata TaxID=167791 RepID=A0ACB9PLA7_BAUVA|nr:hypothetical protein L6164_010132 [Bauhinia variegata]
MDKPSSNSSHPSPSSPPATISSTSITETVWGNHHFKITGFSLSEGVGIGRYIASDMFSIGLEGMIGRSSFTPTGRASSIMSGKDIHFERKLETPYTLKCRGSMWGYKRFFKKTELKKSDYLKDDCLLVNCSVGVVRSVTEGPKIFSIAMPDCNMEQEEKTKQQLDSVL